MRVAVRVLAGRGRQREPGQQRVPVPLL
jgi:hypothetical protein